MTRGIRPTSLAEVVSIAGGGHTLSLDEFYLAFPDRTTMQAMMDARPALDDDIFGDSYIGTVGEHLALRRSLSVPEWTNEVGRMIPCAISSSRLGLSRFSIGDPSRIAVEPARTRNCPLVALPNATAFSFLISNHSRGEASSMICFVSNC